MLPDRVSNPGPLTYESGALPIALRGPAVGEVILNFCFDTVMPPFRLRIFSKKLQPSVCTACGALIYKRTCTFELK